MPQHSAPRFDGLFLGFCIWNVARAKMPTRVPGQSGKPLIARAEICKCVHSVKTYQAEFPPFSGKKLALSSRAPVSYWNIDSQPLERIYIDKSSLCKGQRKVQKDEKSKGTHKPGWTSKEKKSLSASRQMKKPNCHPNCCRRRINAERMCACVCVHVLLYELCARLSSHLYRPVRCASRLHRAEGESHALWQTIGSPGMHMQIRERSARCGQTWNSKRREALWLNFIQRVKTAEEPV